MDETPLEQPTMVALNASKAGNDVHVRIAEKIG
jgi:hypothetical protein